MSRSRPYLFFIRQRGGSAQFIRLIPLTPFEKRNLPYLLLYKLRYESNPDGLPIPEELARCDETEEAIERIVGPLGGVYGGHVMSQGLCLAVFHSPIRIESPVTFHAAPHQWETLYGECRFDPRWEWWQENMEATEEETDGCHIERVIAKLTENGDVPSIPREVDFFSYFPSKRQREEFRRSMATHGFYFTEASDRRIAHPHYPYACEYDKQTPLDLEFMVRQLGILRAASREHGGEFDGWASPVVRSPYPAAG